MGISLFVICFVCFLNISLVKADDIETLEELQKAIKVGDNKKVGFLSLTNFQSVKTVLPSNVQVVVCDGEKEYFGIRCKATDDLLKLVKDGKLIAGLISGLPEEHHAAHVHVFSSTLISPRAMFMVPDVSFAHPHGAPPQKSSRDLSRALNAAIVRVQTKGLDEKARLANMPFELVMVRTCKSDDYAAFPVPSKSNATGLLRYVLDTKILKLGAFGPFNWGDNDGNYLVTPHRGFYPDLMEAIMGEFRNLSGPDGEKYGDDIALQRVWSKTSTFRDLFDGKSHVTEPYYLIDASYTGTGEPCTNSSDCRPAAIPGGREFCDTYRESDGKMVRNATTGELLKKCQHPERAIIDFFRLSCTTLGSDSTFFTKKSPLLMKQTTGELSTGAIVGIIIGVVVLITAAVFICYLVQRERQGQPVFQPIKNNELG
ncbi:uncharacterized protein LOC106172641 [Lingula anatina]|uniref:Uncharacterized protein LOC106172641 n=1 Tax=Lingula anatina TaxID=7574 RepID=A0A1S3JEX2_LINAN|nr:uncharacterized protein LOC106172641 [Lingula anatina]|eukprot:XP_013408888.1 uncharacterized protein LOC106172641 [Lingula anatina]